MLSGLSRYNFFVDMDGVLVDFDRHFTQHTGLKFFDVEETKGAAFAWSIVKLIDNFWLDLQPMQDMQELWSFVEPFRPFLLSSPGRHDTARAIVQKREWVNRFLGVKQPLILAPAKQKSQYARPNAILIDDWKLTIESWTKAGGVAIHHQSAKNTIEKILEYADAEITGDIFDFCK